MDKIKVRVLAVLTLKDLTLNYLYINVKKKYSFFFYLKEEAIKKTNK
jgi:hypothetical protein